MRVLAISLVFTFVLVCIPQVSEAALVPCDGPDCQSCHFIQLGKNILDFLIMILTTLGALVIAISGFKMIMAGGDPGAISDARETITNIVIGIIITLTAWLIVDTVMKTFVRGGGAVGFGPWNEIQCVAQPTGGGAVTGIGNGGTSTPNNSGGVVSTTGCAGQCSAIPNGVTVKQGACSGSSGCTISSEIALQVSEMDRLLDNAGITWQVTEAYPPTVKHQNSCHQNGTCIDANCIGGCSASEIKTFIEQANTAGMRAVWEVKTQAEVDSLLLAGVPSQNVLRVGAITAPHFSVYKKN